jgi:hypothetical protein
MRDGRVAMWHRELGLSEEALVFDLGACPWCGAEYVHVADNGMAAGRKPPDDCCVRGTLAAVARISAAMHGRLAADEREHLAREASRLAAKLRAVPKEELREAAREVEGRYALRVDWGALLARIRRGA